MRKRRQRKKLRRQIDRHIQNTRLIAVAGLITGVAASFSMAASEYLSTKSEGGGQNPVKSALYTGFAYAATVVLLITPYFIFQNVYLALATALANAVLVIFVFTFYISIARDLSFKKRFLEMVGISLGVAVLTFLFGFFIRRVLHIEV